MAFSEYMNFTAAVAPNVKRGISNLHGRLRAHNVKWHKGPQSRREMSNDKTTKVIQPRQDHAK